MHLPAGGRRDSMECCTGEPSGPVFRLSTTKWEPPGCAGAQCRYSSSCPAGVGAGVQGAGIIFLPRDSRLQSREPAVIFASPWLNEWQANARCREKAAAPGLAVPGGEPCAVCGRHRSGLHNPCAWTANENSGIFCTTDYSGKGRTTTPHTAPAPSASEHGLRRRPSGL